MKSASALLSTKPRMLSLCSNLTRGAILEVNRRACENLGYTREELIGQSIFLFDVNFSAEWLEQNVRPPMEAGETMIFETRHRRKDGTVFPVEIRARTFQYQGRVLNLSLALDITERKRVEEERERLRQLEARSCAHQPSEHDGRVVRFDRA